MQYSVLDGFYPWVREGCIACSRGQGVLSRRRSRMINENGGA